MPGFLWSSAKTLGEDGWNARNLAIYSHSGTHMDAPAHFGLPGTIDEIPALQFMGKAWMAKLKIQERQQLIQVEDIDSSIIERLKAGDSLLLQTQWNPELGWDIYRNDLPRVSEELARWCVKKRVKMLGVEPPSVADVNNLDEVTRIHHILLGGGVIILEGLINLKQIQSPQVVLIALPLKIEQGDGAPARVIALEPKRLI